MVHVQVVMTGLGPTTCTHNGTWPPQGAGCRETTLHRGRRYLSPAFRSPQSPPPPVTCAREPWEPSFWHPRRKGVPPPQQEADCLGRLEATRGSSLGGRGHRKLGRLPGEGRAA